MYNRAFVLKDERPGDEELHALLDSDMRSLSLSEEEKESLKAYPFLTAKKVLYAANVSEEFLPS